MKNLLLLLSTVFLSFNALSATEITISLIEEETVIYDDGNFACTIDFTPCQIYQFCNTDTDPCIFVNFDWTAANCAIQNLTFTSTHSTCNKANPTPADAYFLPAGSSCGLLSTWNNSGLWFDYTGSQDRFNVQVTMTVIYICGPSFYDICTITKTKTFEVLIC